MGMVAIMMVKESGGNCESDYENDDESDDDGDGKGARGDGNGDDAERW